MPYKHGVSANLIPSQPAFPPSGVGALPVYVGTAPVNVLADPEAAFNKVLLVNSLAEAKLAVGYSDDWATFTLCEAIDAHFNNPLGNMGPIVLINIFDPATDTKEGTADVALVNQIGYIDNEKVLLESVAIADKVLGTDYEVEYVVIDGKNKVKVTDISELGMASPVTVTFDELDITKIVGTDVVGTVDADGNRTGLQVADFVYQDTGLIPTILAAPGWSQDPVVYTGLVSKCQAINSHWDAICVADIDLSSVEAQTIAEAKTWKDTNGYISKLSKIFWPMAKYGAKLYHISTLAVVMMMQTDYEHDNIPYASPSNRQILATGAALADGTEIKFDEVQANDLNSVGITTMAFLGGLWRLWGPHMANYTYAAESGIKPEDLFDCTVRMQGYLKNTFQENYLVNVDQPFNRRQIDQILDSAQLWLNSLIADRALLYGSISFNTQSNPADQLAAGNFVFDVNYTSVPPGKSITFEIQYDPAGLAALTEA
ncbi:MAG TPA: phage tail sheath protein [Clostridia bacterium]|nr:phage tail sheath protein [Clostridia bacterium]